MFSNQIHILVKRLYSVHCLLYAWPLCVSSQQSSFVEVLTHILQEEIKRSRATFSNKIFILDKCLYKVYFMLGLDVSLHRSLLQQEIKRSRATFSNQIFILDLYLQCTVLTLRLASMCFFMVDFFLEVLQQMQQGIKKSPHNVSKSNSYSEQAPAGYLLYASWHCSFQKCYHKFCVTKHNIPMTILQ